MLPRYRAKTHIDSPPEVSLAPLESQDEKQMIFHPTLNLRNQSMLIRTRTLSLMAALIFVTHPLRQTFKHSTACRLMRPEIFGKDPSAQLAGGARWKSPTRCVSMVALHPYSLWLCSAGYTPVPLKLFIVGLELFSSRGSHMKAFQRLQVPQLTSGKKHPARKHTVSLG